VQLQPALFLTTIIRFVEAKSAIRKVCIEVLVSGELSQGGIKKQLHDLFCLSISVQPVITIIFFDI